MTNAFKILLVEDDLDSREILTSVMQRKFPDLEVHAACNGREAIDIFRTESAEILVTDVNMPEMGGIELAQRVRAAKPDAVIIVITADTGKALLEKSMGDGFKIDHYIYKPVDYRKLFSAVEESVQELLQRRQQ